jgi:hypothetical protein
MLKIPNKAALLAAVTLLSFLPSLPIKPVWAEAPSLGNGILCVARGLNTEAKNLTNTIQNYSWFVL